MRAIVAASLAATALVGRWQAGGRPPLVWDEATRVLDGMEFAFAVRDLSPAATWDWLHAQTFYPPLSSFLHGITFLATNDEVVAAWLPSLIGYGASGVLAAVLARRLGASWWTAAVATAAVLATPISARLAGGAFTETLGACALLAVLLVVSHVEEAPSLARGVWLGVAVFGTVLLKYDYGAIAAGTVALSAFAGADRMSTRRLAAYAASALTSVGLGALFFVFEWADKIAGARQFASQPGVEREIDFGFYPRALLQDAEVGLIRPLAYALLLSVPLAAALCVRRHALRPAVIAVALWYVQYSFATPRHARIVASILPITWVLVATTGEVAIRAVASKRRVSARVLAAVAAAVGAVALATHVPRLGQELWFLDKASPSAAIAEFAAPLLPSSTSQTVVLLGQSNQFSPPTLQVAWSVRLGAVAPAPWVVRETPPHLREAELLLAIRDAGQARVFGVEIGPGSVLDTAESRTTFASQRAYVRLAHDLAGRGVLTLVATTAAEGGKLRVFAWDVR